MTSRFTLLDDAFADPPTAADPGEDVGSLLGALGLPGATYHSFPPAAPAGVSAARDAGADASGPATDTPVATAADTGWAVLSGRTPVRAGGTAPQTIETDHETVPPLPRGAAAIPLSQVFNVLHGRLPPEPSRTRSLREVFREPLPHGVGDRF